MSSNFVPILQSVCLSAVLNKLNKSLPILRYYISYNSFLFMMLTHRINAPNDKLSSNTYLLNNK